MGAVMRGLLESVVGKQCDFSNCVVCVRLGCFGGGIICWDRLEVIIWGREMSERERTRRGYVLESHYK